MGMGVSSAAMMVAVRSFTGCLQVKIIGIFEDHLSKVTPHPCLPRRTFLQMTVSCISASGQRRFMESEVALKLGLLREGLIRTMTSFPATVVPIALGTVNGKGNGYYCCWEGCHRPDEPFSQKSKLQGHFLTHSVGLMSLV
jgi:hypothetical protein